MDREQKSEVRSQNGTKSARTFKDVIVWQKSHDFVLKVYKFTSQFKRAAITISAHMAEGFKKTGKRVKLRFYNISQGSLEVGWKHD